MGGGAELKSPERHVSDQVLGEHLGESGHVEDVLLGIEGHELSAERGQGIHDTGRGAPHAGVERGERARSAPRR